MPEGTRRRTASHDETPMKEAVGGKHIRGFLIPHMKEDRVRWRLLATEVNTVSGGQPSGHATTDSASNHQSCRFVSHCRWGSHEDDSCLGCPESVFFNDDLNEVIYVHRGQTYARLGIAGGFGRHSADVHRGQTYAKLGIAGGFGRHSAGLAWHLRCGVRRCEQ